MEECPQGLAELLVILAAALVVGWAALLAAAYFRITKSTRQALLSAARNIEGLGLPDKNEPMDTQIDQYGWTWTIPQVLVDAGVSPERPIMYLLNICVANRYVIDQNPDRKTVTFKYVPEPLRLVR